ncbi:gamma-glutamyltransferase [bacterium]|nr:gamma-glutamyltransferase [bacterium]
MRLHIVLLAAVSALTLTACAGQTTTADRTAAPPAAPAAETKAWRLEGQAMAAAADPRAVEAALEAMRAGGSAVDAAIAAHAVLGLVEPQSSGLGGGGYMVVYDRKAGTTTVYDGRETAPASATPQLFDVDGKALGFFSAVQSGKSIGVPGAVALYKAAHDDMGKRPWAANFAAAEKLAEDGFIVSPRLASLVGNPRLQGSAFGKNPGTADYFYPGGQALKAGDRRVNKDYAATLRAVATEGPAAFYSGAIAEGIIRQVKMEPNAGGLTLKDLADYKVLKKPALCGPFKAYTICSAPPSSSGGVAMNLILGLYERLSADAASNDEKLADYVLAQQLGYADRDHYVADPAAVTVPVADLLAPAYLDARAKAGFKPGDDPLPGDPGAVLRGQSIIDMWGRDASDVREGTTHMSFVDPEGNAASFTATIEGPFGSARWTNGFLLNNELTDFSRPYEIGGKPVANAPGPGKRPRSSMSPTIVFDGAGDLFMVTGSPGGNSIVGYVSKTLVGVLDWGVSAQEAAALPNIVARGRTVRVETNDDRGKAMAGTLNAAGFRVQEVTGEVSGIHIIVARETGLEGGADPRREGVATGMTQ